MRAVAVHTVALVSVALAVVTCVPVGSVVGGVPASADSVGEGNRTDCTDSDDFCASFPEETVAATDWPYRTNLTVVGNSSTVEITAEELNASRLADIFDGEETDDGVRVAVGDGAIPATFEYSGGGNYTFRVRAVGANRTADARLKLLVGKAPTVSLVPEALTAPTDATAEIGLDLRDTAVGNVTVSGADFGLTARVRDADGDGRVTLVVAFGALDRNGTDAVTAAGDDRVLSANRTGSNRTLSAGRYRIRVGTGGRETDVGRLEVVRERGTATRSVLPTTEPTAAESSAGTTVVEPPGRTSTDGPTAGSAEETPSSGVPGFGVASALVALALSLARARHRR